LLYCCKATLMPALVFLVHDEPRLIDQIAARLMLAGHDVAAFTSTMEALAALEATPRVELLFTRVDFAPGQLNGVALALMASTKRPGIKFVFTGAEEFAHYTEGLGEFMSAPANAREIVNAVCGLLAPTSTFGDAIGEPDGPGGGTSAGRRQGVRQDNGQAEVHSLKHPAKTFQAG
jgi:DNA-binding NtrC family response regulator